MSSTDEPLTTLSQSERSRMVELLLGMTEENDLKELYPLFQKAKKLSMEDKLDLLEFFTSKFGVPNKMSDKLNSICFFATASDDREELMRQSCQRIPLPRFYSVNEQLLMPQEDWHNWLSKCSVLIVAHVKSLLPVLQLLIQKYNAEVDFLTSYIVRSFLLRTIASKDTDTPATFGDGVFALIDRILTEIVPVPSPLLTWRFLSQYSYVYRNRVKVHDGKIDKLWVRYSLGETESFQGGKVVLVKALENLASASPSTPVPLGTKAAEDVLRQTVSLLRSCYHYGHFLMVGSEVLDALSNTFYEVSEVLQDRIAIISYLALRSLLDGDKTNVSLLLDQLYSLAADGVSREKSASKTVSLLGKIESSHTFLPKLKRNLDSKQAARAQSLFTYLEPFSKIRRKAARRSNVAAGKRKAAIDYGHNTQGQVHVNTVGQISQIQDLFPKLGSGFIVKLLDYYEHNTETVTAHLLEDTLPEHLKIADHSEQLYVELVNLRM